MTATGTTPRITKRMQILRPQAEMLEYDKKWGAARGGTRAGKSFGFALWLFFERIQRYPLANHFVVGADYEQLRRGYFDLMIGLLDSFGWESGVDYRYRELPSPMIHFMRLGKGVRLRSLSTQLVERIRGMSIQTLLFEEPQTWGSKVVSGKRLYEILLGRLSHSQDSAARYPDMQPQGRMSFNPPAEGSWLFELIEGQWREAGYKCWRMSVRDNFLLLGREDYVQGLVEGLDPRRHASQIDGHWMVGGGGAYHNYDPAVHCDPPSGIPGVDWIDPDAPIDWTHDFNVKQMCSLIGQVWNQPKTMISPVRFSVPVPDWQPQVVRVLDEFALDDSSTPQVLEAFLASKWYPIARQQGLRLFGDPAGGSRSQTADSRSAARTNWQILYNGLRAAHVKVTMMVARAHPAVKDRVNFMNEQLRTGIGPGMTIDKARCPVFVADLREMDWAANGFDLGKVAGVLGDSSDAAGYYISKLRRPRSTTTFAMSTTRNT